MLSEPVHGDEQRRLPVVMIAPMMMPASMTALP